MIDKDNLPQHIAIIMDGNGRWAKARGLARTAGHRKGISQVKEVVKAAQELGIKYLTLFAFSVQNWDRPKREVNMLMRSLDNFLKRELKELDKQDIRLMVIGRDHPLPLYLQKDIRHAQDYTKDNKGLTLIIALNYGARQEILDAVKKYAHALKEGEENLADLNEAVFEKFFYTSGIPDPDLLIRTSGEMRISNFLLWQISYTELCFINKYWPDFNKEDLEKAVAEYKVRERRFGRI